MTPQSAIINIPGSSTPVMMPAGDIGSTSTYNGFARSRRKSVGQPSMMMGTGGGGVGGSGSIAADSSEEIEPYSTTMMGGGQPYGASKMKRKKSRASSFSLPFHRRRRLSNGGLLKMLDRHSRRAARFATPRRSYCALVLVALLVLLINWWRWSYELQVELSVFSRRWIKSEIDTLQPLKGCFHPHHISPQYNISKHLAPKFNDPSPGIAMKRGMTCYDYSATIGSDSSAQQPLEHLTYHTYWRSDLIPFGDRQSATLIAFLATQPLSHSKLILWSNGADALRENENVKQIMAQWSDYIEIRQADMAVLTKGTELAGILSGAYGGGMYDQKGWVDGDAVRLLVLWHYGGVWMDMDEVLTRDIHPLTESEFVTQWDCYGTPLFHLPHFRLELITHLHRQRILFAQRRAHALRTSLAVPVRGIPHYGLVPTPTAQHLLLGLIPVLETTSSPTREPRQAIRRPAVVLCRSPKLPRRHFVPGSIQA